MCDDVIQLTSKGVFIFGLQVLQVSFWAYNNNNNNNNNNNDDDDDDDDDSLLHSVQFQVRKTSSDRLKINNSIEDILFRSPSSLAKQIPL